MFGGASSGALTFGTGAFTRTTVERGVNVETAPDDEA